jgi:hypothetical protein
MHDRIPLLLAAALWLAPSVSAGQDSIPARVIRSLPGGNYVVRIRNDTLIAITQDAARKSLTLEAELRAAKQEAGAKDSLIGTYELAAKWYDSTLVRQRTLIAQLDSLYLGYRDLASGYKRLGGEPWLTFDGGLGETGRDHKPAVLAGLGIRRVRIWGFLQEANAGGFVGVSLRLF